MSAFSQTGSDALPGGQNIDRLLVLSLREAGHDVSAVAEELSGLLGRSVPLRGQNSPQFADGRFGFGQLAELEREHPPSVILLRLDRLTREARIQRIAEVLEKTSEFFVDHFVVIGPSRVRLGALSIGKPEGDT